MYYPKAKIIENQYTDGGQFTIASTGKSYEGLYHITYDQSYYTGATHTNDSQLLVKVSANTQGGYIPSITTNPANITIQSGSNLIKPGLIANFDYDRVTNNRFSYLSSEVIPVPYYPILSNSDYAAGYFVRYFAKRSGGTAQDIKELSSDGFTDLSTNVLYLSTSLQWKLTGPYHDQVLNLHTTIYGVWDTNARTVAATESTLPGLTQYLGNLVEFARIS